MSELYILSLFLLSGYKDIGLVLSRSVGPRPYVTFPHIKLCTSISSSFIKIPLRAVLFLSKSNLCTVDFNRTTLERHHYLWEADMYLINMSTVLCQHECHAHPYTMNVWHSFTTYIVPHLSLNLLLTTPLPVGCIVSLSEVACQIPLSLFHQSVCHLCLCFISENSKIEMFSTHLNLGSLMYL